MKDQEYLSIALCLDEEQIEIVKMIGKGKTNIDIAETLQRREKSMWKIVFNIKNKLIKDEIISRNGNRTDIENIWKKIKLREIKNNN